VIRREAKEIAPKKAKLGIGAFYAAGQKKTTSGFLRRSDRSAPIEMNSYNLLLLDVLH
jgi:hypothetical protein